MPIDPSDEVVRAAIASADRRRRAREAGRRIWRVAPFGAALALLAAGAHRWFSWPTAIPMGLLLVAASALAAYWFLARRDRAVTDAIAAHVDGDAQLGGELRSASWFAAADARDSWADYHVERAAERVRLTDWTHLYPAIRQPRAWIATATLALAAIALSATLPARAVVQDGRSVGGPTAGSKSADLQAQALILPPELQKRLEELLAGIESGTLNGPDATRQAGELKDLLALLAKQLDPETRKQLEQAAMAAAARGRDPLADAKALAERAKRDAADANTPSELRKALDDIASQLGRETRQNGAPGGESATSTAQNQSSKGNESGQQQANGDPAGASIQFARDSAGGGASQAMMVSSGMSSNDPRPGQGGNRGGRGPEVPPDLAQALRRETIEASTDTTGQNVTTETRRKTEQGKAGASYTHAAAAAFDRGRAASPPPVPETRRAQVHSYFIRKR